MKTRRSPAPPDVFLGHTCNPRDFSRRHECLVTNSATSGDPFSHGENMDVNGCIRTSSSAGSAAGTPENCIRQGRVPNCLLWSHHHPCDILREGTPSTVNLGTLGHQEVPWQMERPAIPLQTTSPHPILDLRRFAPAENRVISERHALPYREINRAGTNQGRDTNRIAMRAYHCCTGRTLKSSQGKSANPGKGSARHSDPGA